MKLTKESETAVLKAYNAYWDSYLKGDMETFASLLDEHCYIIGSTEFDVFTDKRSAVEFYTKTAEQISGKCEFRNRKVTLLPVDENVMVQELCDFYFLADEQWHFYGHTRLSTLLSKKEDGWKIIHQHGSLPDSRTEEGEQIAAEEIAEENKQLRDAIKRRTVELESKNRELEIEAALEKVRSRSLAMHTSDELKDVVTVVFERLKELNIVVDGGVTISVYTEGSRDQVQWVASPDLASSTRFWLPYTDDKIISDHLNAKESGIDFFAKKYSFEEKNHMLNYLFGHTDFKYVPDDIKARVLQSESYSQSIAFAKNSSIFINSYSGALLSGNEVEILKRFSKVFEQAYIRFLDLEKAELQVREAMIEAALEKVRSRTIAMFKSDEMSDSAATVFHQLQTLGIQNLRRSLVGIMNEKEAVWDCWYTTVQGESFAKFLKMPVDGHPIASQMKLQWLNKETIHVELAGESLKSWLQFIMASGWQYPKGEKPPKKFVIYGLPFSNGYLVAFTDDDIAPAEIELLQRFARVFDQTYTRFLDLQKAEGQAREAQIEAALEKVRSRSIGMQKSEELKEVIKVVYEQFVHLNINVEHTGFIMDYKERDDMHIWLADQHEVPSELFIPYFDSAHWNSFKEAKEKGNNFFANYLDHEEKNKFYKSLFKLFPVLDEVKEYYFNCPALAISTVLLDNVSLYIENFQGIPYTDEENKILMRFGKVFQQTYTRFLDLEKAEAQAREAKIEAALEKVRSRTLAMQKSDELAETSAVLFKQLITLGIAPNRLYIGVIHDESGNIEFWITDEDGSKVSTMFSGNAYKNGSMKKMYDGWKLQEKSIMVDMHGKELEDYFHYLGEELRVPFKDGLSQKRRIQYISYFSKGFIGLASPEDQPRETIDLLGRFASVFNLTFTRFNDLKIAEAHALQAEQDLIEIKSARQKAEDALLNLQAAQKQLVQSEKMASLGELTAGIAHEIQNPLNFVNNFSEVNKELLVEMKDEINKGNLADANEIADDVIANEEKINHHGKRADAIVKGMLQHSRSSVGVKEPTDINALADEYLRLSYHGLRAKDKSFNAMMKTDYDESIGKINIIPQDIGRVLLNLYNNAFYAVAERLRQAQPDSNYEPTVTVSIKAVKPRSGGLGVLLTVSDNGNGIPQNIVDKIFQPFFTTKPTGQGTGLGLSLSYDIVKAHGGEIKVESKEGEGTSFIIQLPAL